MPSQPETLPNMPTYPSFQLKDRATRLSQLEVSPPALYIAFPVVSQLVAGSTPIRPPQLSHLRLESFDTLRGYSDPPFPIQSKAGKLTFLDPPCTALGGIHRQSQMLLYPVLSRRQRPFRRCLTAHVNIAVIRITAERMPSPFQFLIERIQIDVGQQRR